MRALTLVLVLGWAHAEPLSLQAAMDAAATAPGVTAAEARAAAADDNARAAWRAATLPSLGATAQAQRIWDPLSINTPGGPLQTEPGHVLSAGVEVRQPVVDVAGWRAANAVEKQALAARKAAVRTQRERQASAAQAWLEVARIDARAQALDRLLDALGGRAGAVRAAFDAGAGRKIDVLKIDLALTQAKEARQALALNRPIALAALTRWVGREVSDIGDADTAMSRAPDRADVAAVRAQIDAREAEVAAVKAEWIPSLEAVGRAVYADTDIVDRGFFEGMVTLTWVPFASGTRAPRADAARAQRAALEATLLDLERGAQLQAKSAAANLAVAENRAAVARAAEQTAAEAVRVERARYEAGEATVNELLAAEADAADASGRVALAAVDIRAAQVARWLAGR